MSESESENNSDSNEIESSDNEDATEVVDEPLNPEKSEDEIVSWKDLVIYCRLEMIPKMH